jgi:DNA-binding PadR family transcriptional regulator
VLLLSEHPGHGYQLVKELAELRFGRVDGPAVYRALAQLEADDLISSWSETPKAGQARRVYSLTPRGERVLRSWMGVIKEERDSLDRVLRRYQATGTVEAVLADVEGNWATALGQDWSPVSSTSPTHRPRRPAATSLRPTAHAARGRSVSREFQVVPDRSVLLIEARSSVGPISFGAVGVTGVIEAGVRSGIVVSDPAPSAHLEMQVDGLRSGNSVYDGELLRRIDARRFPIASIDLRESAELDSGNRFRLDGEVTFHGVTRAVQGTVTVTSSSERKLVIAGEQVFDIRDFDIPSPTVLMLRIYPDVRVHLHVEAEVVA